MSKITDLDKKIKDSIVEDRQKDYGDYQHNFTMLAEMFTLVLFDSLKKRIRPHQVGHIMMALKLRKKDIALKTRPNPKKKLNE